MRLPLLLVAMLAFVAGGYLGYDRGASDLTTLVTVGAGVVALVAFRLSPGTSWQSSSPQVVTQPRERQRELSALAGNLDALADAQEARLSSAIAGRSRVSVRLTSTGRNQIAVIKALRSELKLGLKEAKDLTDAAKGNERPLVAEGLTPERAMRLATSVEAAGGRIELE